MTTKFIHEYKYKEFSDACELGYIDTVQVIWHFFQKHCDPIIINRYLEFGFISACLNGHLNIVQYLVELNTEIHSHNEEGFRMACWKGHLDIVQYLTQLYKTTKYNMIDIHAENEEGFRSACMHGHIYVVQYLAQLHKHTKYNIIDIHKKHKQSFKLACEHDHIDIVRYLLQLQISKSYRCNNINETLDVIPMLDNIKKLLPKYINNIGYFDKSTTKFIL